MVDEEVVMDRVALIRKSLKRLRELANVPRDEFKIDDDCFAIAEHHLRRSLEAILDIGRHICVKEDLGQPQDYTEIFEILGNNGILESEFTKKIKGMAGYRNRLVHMYNQISLNEIYRILQDKLDDFEVFISAVMDYINDDKEDGKEDKNKDGE